MRRRCRVVSSCVALLAGFLVAAPAGAQWVRLQRCSGALPCALPFGVRYAPDPLIASQYGQVSPTAFSGRISFEPGLAMEIDQPHLSLDLRDFSEEAARRFVLAHPLPPKTTPKPTPPAAPKRN